MIRSDPLTGRWLVLPRLADLTDDAARCKLIGLFEHSEGGSLERRQGSHGDDSLTRTISQHIRGSYSLTDGFAVGNDMTIYPDRGGLGIITERNKEGGLDQILRAFLCQGLVMAYADVFRELARESAAAIKSSKKTMHSNLPAVYDKFLLFLGGYYTAFPIQRDRHELYKIWEALSNHNDVEKFRTEIEVQLSRLGDFISAEKQARRERRQKALGGIIAALSLVIAAASIPPEMLASLLDTAEEAWDSITAA